MTHPTNCPKCNVSWNSDKSMPEELLEANPDFYKTIEKATASATEFYGWTKENDSRFGKNCVMWEYDRDRAEQIQCLVCKTFFNINTMVEEPQKGENNE